MRPEGWHIVIIVVIAIVLFGAPKLPGLARSVGQSLRIFKSEVRQMKEDTNVGDAFAGEPSASSHSPRSEGAAKDTLVGSPERQSDLR